MQPEKPKFKPFQQIIWKDMLDLGTRERIPMKAIFIRYLTHLHWKGYAEIRVGSTHLNISLERLEADE